MSYEVGDKVKNGKRSEKEGGEGGGEEKVLNIIVYVKCVFIFLLIRYYFF